MQKVNLITPQKQPVARVKIEELQDFLVDRSLAYRKLNIHNTFVVFDSELENIIEDAIANKNKVSIIRRYRNSWQLTQDLSNKLSNTEIAIFIPRRGLRHFYNTAGFISCCHKIVNSIPNSEILIPPGVYDGCLHMFGLKNSLNIV